MSDAQQLLEVAVEAARGAGTLLLERVGRGAEQEVESKSTPTDLVSAADLAAESAIRELLRQRRPHDGFVGEEGGSEAGSSGLSWVVDPLDGTVNFLFGIPQWCVSVAVRDGEGMVAGAVYDPNREELFTATRGGPATLLRAGGSIELNAGGFSASAAHGAEDSDGGPAGNAAHSAENVTGGPAGNAAPARLATMQLATAMVATGLAYDATVRAAQAQVLERLIPRVRDVRRFGSAALDLAWTAMGRYDAYFERTVKEWDIAAGTLICERAGLVVLELPAGENLPWGVLVARPELARELLELVG